jgi:hypothetical protein
MANQVYANMMEVSCKAAQGKSICAFPDVCMTPPQTPATPPGVPIPYPNTGMASDCTEGSTSVKISGQEVMLKNKSYFKKSMGDEAGCAPKKGLITSKNMGKVYFNMWSMDVKFEGENVVRMLDITTHNHASVPGNSPTWPYIDEATVPDELKQKCAGDKKKEETACAEYKPHGSKDVCAELANPKPTLLKGDTKPVVKATKADPLSDEVAANKCLEARRCGLQPYKPSGCCPPQTPHHLIEGSALFSIRAGKKGASPLTSFPNGNAGSNTAPYNVNKAPCVCAEGVGHDAGGTHELMHTIQSANAMEQPAKALTFADNTTQTVPAWTYKDAKKSATGAFKQVFQQSGCSEECIEAQLDAYHSQCGINDATEIKAVATSAITPEELAQAIAEADARNSMALLSKLAEATDTSVAWMGD